MTQTDFITIIRARHGKRLAKLICADGTVKNYDSAFAYDMTARPVPGLDGLAALLRRLMDRRDCAVVRGEIIDPTRSIDVRRLVYADKTTGHPPTLREAAHSWLALDMEGVPRPESLPAADLTGCAREALKRLPVAFCGARCIAQATASHGIKPGCRVRLWYWLDRPADNAELARWLRNTPADPSVFRTAQPIYTAVPAFAPSVVDHLPQRMVELPGAPMVVVPQPDALAPPPRPAAPPPAHCVRGSSAYAFAALTRAAVRVRQSTVGSRHKTMLREARSLARFVDTGLMTESDIAGVLQCAGKDAGMPQDEIRSLVVWAMAHPSGAPLPEGVAG